jgi:hypothetical protein
LWRQREVLSAGATFPQTLFFGPFAKLSEFARLRVRANDRLALIQIGKCEKRRMTEASIESDGIDVFVVYNGVRIAKRGDPDTPKLVFGFR